MQQERNLDFLPGMTRAGSRVCAAAHSQHRWLGAPLSLGGTVPATAKRIGRRTADGKPPKMVR